MRNTEPELAYINGEVLDWAILRAEVTYSDVAKKVKVTDAELTQWVKGVTYPQFKIAQHLADILQVPFGALFLPEPPTAETPIPDLRTLSNSEQRQPSLNFTDLLNEVMSRQDWYHEFAVQTNSKRLWFVGSHPIGKNTKEVAASIRTALDLMPQRRRTVKNWEAYLSLLSRQAESIGILVMRSSLVGNNTGRKLSAQEFQGFAISDNFAPLVFVNSADYKRAQIFTLLHEIAHIWIGQSGISNPEHYETPDRDPNAPMSVRFVEEFCNAVATEALVPEHEFLTVYTSASDYHALAKHFWVSPLVILRRALELKKISRQTFFALREKERQSMTTDEVKDTSKEKSGGDFFQNAGARFGTRFPAALMRDVKRGGTAYRDAATLLAVRVPTIRKLMEMLT
jgi:Zn-dependent peptidase ImmA (M78 family)